MAVKTCIVIGCESGRAILALSAEVEREEIFAVRSVARCALRASATVRVAEEYLVTYSNICDLCADFQHDASA
jgi:hypothetical protein